MTMKTIIDTVFATLSHTNGKGEPWLICWW